MVAAGREKEVRGHSLSQFKSHLNVGGHQACLPYLKDMEIESLEDEGTHTWSHSQTRPGKIKCSLFHLTQAYAF